MSRYIFFVEFFICGLYGSDFKVFRVEFRQIGHSSGNSHQRVIAELHTFAVGKGLVECADEDVVDFLCMVEIFTACVNVVAEKFFSEKSHKITSCYLRALLSKSLLVL